MRADMVYPQPRGLRARVAEAARAKVREWIDGPQVSRWDTPTGINMTAAYPSWQAGKVMHGVPGEPEPTIQLGRYSGFHYTATIIPGGQHHFDWVSTLHIHVEDGEWVQDPSHVFSKGPVVVGADCFIGYEAVVMSGVTLGDGSVVGARAVVSRDVEPYSIVVGNPAKHVKYRFEQPVREALLRIRWWDWDTDTVAAHASQIHSPDVAEFVAAHDPDLGPPDCALCAAG